MEENLNLINRNNDYIASSKDIDELIAFSKWIIDFQTMSDANNYGAIGWNKLSIREDYIVEIEETKKHLSDAHMITQLRYKYGDYRKRNQSIDEKYYTKITEKFKKDTGLSFNLIISLLSFLESNYLISKLIKNETAKVINNIVEIPIDILAKEFISENEYSLEDFYNSINFISINTNKLADKFNVIPIWEKKKRKHKISAQPILHVKDKLIYSPIALYQLRQSWIQGMFNFILPYDVDMKETITTINQWKKEYENKIVEDLTSLFDDSNCTVYPDKELYKLDKKGNHSRDLGDYDLIVINELEKKVFLFEVKYMRISKTMKDSMGDQKEYFIGKKAKGNKFERRVKYFNENKSIILMNLGLEGNYNVQSYFVTNKNIRSFFHDYPFKIISFNEVKAKLESGSFWIR